MYSIFYSIRIAQQIEEPGSESEPATGTLQNHISENPELNIPYFIGQLRD
jgi:hypothetical protein